jgi:hypothetical protein
MLVPGTFSWHPVLLLNHQSLLTISSLSTVKPIIFHLERKECFDYELIYIKRRFGLQSLQRNFLCFLRDVAALICPYPINRGVCHNIVLTK